MIRRFLLWLTGQPTHEQQTITRLLDMYERVVDAALLSKGLEGVRGDVGESSVARSLSSPSDFFDEEEERKAEETTMIEEYAVKACMSTELFEQAQYNAVPGNHPQCELWRRIVRRAEEMGVLAD